MGDVGEIKPSFLETESPGAILGFVSLECLSLADTTVIQWQSTAGNGVHFHIALLL